MQWDTPNHLKKPKSNDWFASVIVLSGAFIFISILMDNYVMAALILSIAIALIIVHSSPEEPQNIELRTGGIIVGNKLYPWETIEAFSIKEYFGIPRLILKSKRKVYPIISIHINEETVDIEELHEVLSEILKEEDINEPFLFLMAERLGLH